MSSADSRPPDSPVEQLMTYPWVTTIRETDSPDATHIVDLSISTVDDTEHLDRVREVGATDIAIAAHGDYGQRLYVSLP